MHKRLAKTHVVGLEHLRLRIEIPKPLPTYHPNIEDEFLPSKSSAYRRELKNSEKVVKRKTKKLQKDAQRELKKDTQTIQRQKEEENSFRKKAAKSYKIGQKGIRDEV